MRLILLSVILLTSATMAQSAPGLDAKSAQAIVAGCVAHSTAKQQSHAIVVVDTGGHPVAALRMDGNGTGIFDFSMAKAQAAAAWGFSTAQMLENARGTPGFAEAPHVVIVPGGVPVKYTRKFLDYRAVQQTLVPYRTLLLEDGRQSQESRVLTITYGVKVSDSIFQRPEG